MSQGHNLSGELSLTRSHAGFYLCHLVFLYRFPGVLCSSEGSFCRTENEVIDGACIHHFVELIKPSQQQQQQQQQKQRLLFTTTASLSHYYCSINLIFKIFLLQ